MKSLKSILIAATALSALATGTALSEERDDGEVNDLAELHLMSGAKLSLADAIQVAEKEAGAKALDASFDGSSGVPIYHVELSGADGARLALSVDGATGAVTSAGDNPSDHEDVGEEEAD